MAFTSWRGIVGMIAPTMRPGMTEEVIRLLPEGIGVIPLFLDVTRGDESEFETVMAAYEEKVASLARAGCDLVHPIGAPPFMLKGVEGERRLVAEWEARYGVPIFTAPQNHVAALGALGAKSIVGATYFPERLNRRFAAYLAESGLAVASMEGIDVAFDKVQELAAEQVYVHIRKSVLRSPDVDAIYMLGSGWRTLPIVETLERDFGLPVVHPVTARVWEIQKRLHVRETRNGFGRLLREMP